MTATRVVRDRPELTESQFQQQILGVATLRGWLAYHTHDSRRSAAGFPDLVLVRDRVIFAEVKRARGSLSVAQEQWIGALRAAGQEAYVWRPSDWDRICTVLARRSA